MPPGGCGLPLAYVRRKPVAGTEIAGTTDLESTLDLLCEDNRGGIRRESGFENGRVAAARRASDDLATFIVAGGCNVYMQALAVCVIDDQEYCSTWPRKGESRE